MLAHLLVTVVDYWHSMPPAAKIAVIGIVVKYMADGLRLLSRRIQGRYMHYLVGALAIAVSVSHALVQGNLLGTWGPVVLQAVLTMAAAVGYNELTTSQTTTMKAVSAELPVR